MTAEDKAVHVNLLVEPGTITQRTHSGSYRMQVYDARFPNADVTFSVVNSRSAGGLHLASNVLVTNYGGSQIQLDLRDGLHYVGGLDIDPVNKYSYGTTLGTWKGGYYQVQMQVLEDPRGFRLCLYKDTPNVKRLACTIHAIDSGNFIGVYALDASDGVTREFK